MAARNHGEAAVRTPEHRAWAAMVSRCTSPSNVNYKDYGLRGSTVCSRWRKYENFLQDMGRRPFSAHSLERVNNEGPYCKKNCRWATAKEQANNRRSTHLLQYQGQLLSLQQVAERAWPDVPADTARSRLYNRVVRRGMPVDLAVAAPVSPSGGRFGG